MNRIGIKRTIPQTNEKIGLVLSLTSWYAIDWIESSANNSINNFSFFDKWPVTSQWPNRILIRHFSNKSTYSRVLPSFHIFLNISPEYWNVAKEINNKKQQQRHWILNTLSNKHIPRQLSKNKFGIGRPKIYYTVF